MKKRLAVISESITGFIINSVPFLFILLAFYIPLANLLITGFSPSAIADSIADAYYRRVFLFTLKQAFLSAFFSMLPGIAGAWVLVNFRIPGKRIIRSVTAVPFVLPSILVVLGFVLLFGNNGLVNSVLMKILDLDKPPFRVLYSFRAIILAHVFYNCPLFIRLVSTAWEKISTDVIEAAQSLGASRLRVFCTAVLPQIIPPVIAAFSLVFILCFMSFSIILVLGGGPKYTTLEVEIYRLSRFSMDITSACSLAILQSSVTLSFLFLYSFFQKKASAGWAEGGSSSEYAAELFSAGSHAGASSFFSGRRYLIPSAEKNRDFQKKPDNGRIEIVLASLFFVFLFIVIFMPLVMIIFESFRYRSGYSGNSVLSIRWYLKLFSEAGIRPVIGSLFVSGLNVLVTVFVSVAALSLIKRRKTVLKTATETFFMMSMGVSSIILSLAFVKFRTDYDLQIHPVALLSFAHSAVFLPLVYKSVSVFYDRIDQSLIETAESLGAGRKRVFLTVEFPAIRGGIITGGVLAFSLSMGEINTTLMLAPEGFITIPVAIYRLIGSYNFSQACAMGTILILTCILGFFVIDNSGSLNI